MAFAAMVASPFPRKMSTENAIAQTLEATPLLVPPPRPEESTGSTPSATSDAEDNQNKPEDQKEAWGGEAAIGEASSEEETREINADEIPEEESSEESYDGAPAQFASHIFFQKGLHGGNGVNFTLTRRKGRQYIQVSQAEDESVPVDFFRDCLNHATGSRDETELLEAQRQNEFTDIATGSCAAGAALGVFFLIWMWYIISGVVQISAHKC